MPLYEYECESCGARFERLQSIQAEPVRQCPECAGSVHKIMHAAGIIFKGSGWYITDSRKSTSGAIAGESKPTSAETTTVKAAAPEPKNDAKPAAKTESKTTTE